MDTRIVRVDPGLGAGRIVDTIREAASCLASGGLVAFPTETVYGLGANALSAEAVSTIFTAKGRPSDNPLIVHIHAKESVAEYATGIPGYVRTLMDVFWPGPLTLVLDRKPCIPDAVTAGLDTVGVRMPAHPVALALLKASGVPIAAPSANLSGKPSPTTADHVIRDLSGRVDWIIDGGVTEVGVESTVLDARGDTPIILRPGGVTREDILAVVGRVSVDPGVNGVVDGPVRSPGMKYRHYSPDADAVLFVGPEDGMASEIESAVRKAFSTGRRVGVICSNETLDAMRVSPDLPFAWGSRRDTGKLASHLYKALRACDESHVDVVFIEGVSDEGIGNAVMNRLIRAVGGSIHDFRRG